MAWFRKDKQPLKAEDRRDVPSDVFDKCQGCGEILYGEKLAQNLQVCPSCGHHFRMAAERYVEILLDEGSFEEMDRDISSADPLEFQDLKAYVDRLKTAESKVGRKEAVLSGTGTLEGMAVTLAVMDFRFVGGSMGSVVGEKIARGFEYATEKKLPVIFVSGSGGGARMYEGCLSLMQMAKTSAAIARHSKSGGFYVSILTNPTMAGVMASFAALGDVIIAEPKALIGFTGPRVIQQTIKQELPKGFQTSEFLMEHGFLDRIVVRSKLKSEVNQLLGYLAS